MVLDSFGNFLSRPRVFSVHAKQDRRVSVQIDSHHKKQEPNSFPLKSSGQLSGPRWCRVKRFRGKPDSVFLKKTTRKNKVKCKGHAGKFIDCVPTGDREFRFPLVAQATQELPGRDQKRRERPKLSRTASSRADEVAHRFGESSGGQSRGRQVLAWIKTKWPLEITAARNAHCGDGIQHEEFHVLGRREHVSCAKMREKEELTW